MKKILNKLIRNEQGQALIFALIMLAVGSLIVVPLLAFMSTGLMAAQTVEEKMNELYAADAGVEDAIYNILNNNALLPQEVGDVWTYNIGTVNNKSVDVEVMLEENIESFLEELLGDDAGTHSEWTVISHIAAPGIYEITITWDPPPPGHVNKKINGVGAWFEGVYTYVEYSAVGMTDDYPVYDFRTESYKGGTAFIWEWTGNNRPTFGPESGLFTMTLTFEYEPANIPAFYFSWFVGGSMDVGVVVAGQTFGIWKVTATAEQTQVVAFISSNGEAVPYRVKILTWEVNP